MKKNIFSILIIIGIIGVASLVFYYLFRGDYSFAEKRFLKEEGFKEEKSATLVEQNLNSLNESFRVLATKLDNNVYSMAFKLENKTDKQKEFYLIPVSRKGQMQFQGIRGVIDGKNNLSINKADILNKPLDQLYDITDHKKQLGPELSQAYDDIKDKYQAQPVKVSLNPNSVLLAKSDWVLEGKVSDLRPVYLLVYGSAGGAKEKFKYGDLEKNKIKKIDSGGYAFKSSDDEIIELNTEAEIPYLKLNKWDGEVSMKISMPQIDKNSSKDLTDKKLSLVGSGKKNDLIFKVKTKEVKEKKSSGGKNRDFTFNEDGGVEFDLVLKEKPNTNVFSYNIETDNLNYFYQPPLNEEINNPDLSCTATECVNSSGETTDYRPEEVVGSYAVYHKTRSGDYSAMGGENYMAGKAFHIYRPKVYEQNNENNWTWGKLNVTGNTLTVTVDQDWLDDASYPVVVDPNFGYEKTGDSYGSTSADYVKGNGPFTPAYSGSATSVTFRYFKGTGVANVTHGIYASSGGSPGGQSLLGDTNGFDIAETGNLTLNLDQPVAITAGTTYFIGLNNSVAQTYTYRDSGSAVYDVYYKASVYSSGSLANPFPSSPILSDGYIYTCWVTYNATSTITSVNDYPDPLKSGDTITFSVDWNDGDAEGIKMYICKASDGGTSGCGVGGTWCSNSDDFDLTNPISCAYGTQNSDIGNNSYYVYVCDDGPSCSAASSGTFTVEAIGPPSKVFKGGTIFKGGGTIK
jgi:hypothetical protein